MKACELLWRTFGVLNAAVGEAEPALQALGLDPKQMYLLSLLDHHPHPAELSRAMVTPAPTVTFLIKRAEADGFVKRYAVAGDLRKHRLTLTAKGRRVMERGREAMDEAFARRLATLSASERKAFERTVVQLETSPTPSLKTHGSK